LEDSYDEELNEDELSKLQNEADIEHFNAILAHAQAMAVKMELERTHLTTCQLSKFDGPFFFSSCRLFLAYLILSVMQIEPLALSMPMDRV
jgi:hypothetical protein